MNMDNNTTPKIKITVTDQRQKTMLLRIGEEAAELIENKQYLPFFRSAQIKLEKIGRADEWQRLIATAKTKANPKRYFATLCKMVKDGTYRFVEKFKEVAKNTANYINDKIKRFGFDEKYQKYWIRQCDNYIKKCSMAGFVHLLELADRKNMSQRYFARSIKNQMKPDDYYKFSVKGAKS